MIRENTLTSVVALADKLASANVLLAPVESSPLSALICAGSFPMPDAGGMSQPFEQRLLMGTVHKNPQGICEHDLVMDEIVEVVEKTINFNLDVAQNQVNPMIKRVLDFTQEFVNNKQALDPSDITISPIQYHAAWSSHYLVGMVERFTETPVNDVRLSMKVPMPVVQNEFELISTGLSRFDEELMDLVSTLEPGTISDLYRRLFVVENEEYVPQILQYVNYLRVNPNQPLLVFLIAQKLVDNIPEGVNVSPQMYSEYISSIMAQAGRALCRQIERRESIAKNRILINGWPNLDADDLGLKSVVIEVNGDVYNKWLQDGGTPEVIFGSFVSDRATNYDLLLERKEGYSAAWMRQQRMLETSRRLQLDNHMLLGLNKAMEQEILELPEDQLLTDRKKYLSLLNDHVRQMPNGWQKDNLYCSVRKIVCSVIYPHTMAFDILVAIDAACEAHSDLPTREAAFFGAMEVVGDWLAQLIKVDGSATA